MATVIEAALYWNSGIEDLIDSEGNDLIDSEGNELAVLDADYILTWSSEGLIVDSSSNYIGDGDGNVFGYVNPPSLLTCYIGDAEVATPLLYSDRDIATTSNDDAILLALSRIHMTGDVEQLPIDGPITTLSAPMLGSTLQVPTEDGRRIVEVPQYTNLPSDMQLIADSATQGSGSLTPMQLRSYMERGTAVSGTVAYINSHMSEIQRGDIYLCSDAGTLQGTVPLAVAALTAVIWDGNSWQAISQADMPQRLANEVSRLEALIQADKLHVDFDNDGNTIFYYGDGT